MRAAFCFWGLRVEKGARSQVKEFSCGLSCTINFFKSPYSLRRAANKVEFQTSCI